MMQEAVEQAASQFPLVFGLRAFPGKRFKVGIAQSYISEGVVVLYTQVWNPERSIWVDFAKGTVDELSKEVVDLPLIYSAEEYHRIDPGRCLRTDVDMTKILETAPASGEIPRTGGLWWRTHHLVRQLGGRA